MDAASLRRRGLEWGLLVAMALLLAVSLLFAPAPAPARGTLQVGLLKLQHLYHGMLEPDGVAVKKELMQHLAARDLARQHRILSDVIGFPVGGTADPHIAGLYFTQIKLGTPAKSYFVQVDTGSDVLWLNCKPCQSCPTSSNLGISLLLYDPITSSTCTPIKCKDPTCDVAAKITQAGCNSVGNCGYIFQYGDGSSTEGYLVEDAFLYEAVVPGSALQPVEARLTFGCGYNQSGDLLTPIRALDGILGLGQNDLSVISQLASQGRAPKVFAHCLQGLKHGGGALVLGNVKEYGFVYTPIIPTRLHYSVELKSILVSGIALNVDPAAFETSNVKGTIFDSGTTLTYLTEIAYEPLVNAILASVPVQAQPVPLREEMCFLYSGSVDSHFPNITLRFNGGDMELKASNYLIQQISDESPPVWCFSWKKSTPGSPNNGAKLTILGDLVLKDKIIVYDLEKQQIGWVNFDCSSTLTVAATGEDHYARSGDENSASIPTTKYQIQIIAISILAIFFALLSSHLYFMFSHFIFICLMHIISLM